MRICRTIGTETCALDVVDKGSNTLTTIARATGMTREGVRQSLVKALRLARERMNGVMVPRLEAKVVVDNRGGEWEGEDWKNLSVV